MQFIQGNNRHQTYFSTLENQICTDNPVRLMDAFIDKLELQKLGFTNMVTMQRIKAMMRRVIVSNRQLPGR